MSETIELPVLDASAVARSPNAAFGHEVLKALTTTGFFYVVNHGIDLDNYAKFLEEWNTIMGKVHRGELHARDLMRPGRQRGLLPFGLETGADAKARKPNPMDGWSECWPKANYGRELRRFGQNISIPGHQEFQVRVHLHMRANYALSRRILESTFAALCLPVELFEEMFARGASLQRVLRYMSKAEREQVDCDAWLTSPHVDACWATQMPFVAGLLLGTLREGDTDTRPDFDPENDLIWHTPNAVEGAVLVDSGMMFNSCPTIRERCDQLGLPYPRATWHGVREAPTDGVRLSSPWFLHPHADVIVERTPEGVEVDAFDYRNNKLASLGQFRDDSRS